MRPSLETCHAVRDTPPIASDKSPSRRAHHPWGWILACCLAAATPLAAHINLVGPNGGEVLMAGEEVSVNWEIQVQHDLQNWDVWYSTSGANGPWIPIATDLPPGDPTSGSQHTFEWTVPADPSALIRLRVRQDNSGMDYLDVSDNDLAILGDILFADGFENGDLGGWSGSKSN